ncbi:50S ribosomal protein L18 [Patescibacteria group bacterium]|nr:50S ribosomal protein L18 [Patescibacteria group bacterium]
MNKRDNRRARIKKTIRGTKETPRLVVFRSNRYIYGQLINDATGQTLVSVDKITDAAVAGKELAEKASKLKVKNVVFDRAGYKYHGNVKKFAEAAREAGLVF